MRGAGPSNLSAGHPELLLCSEFKDRHREKLHQEHSSHRPGLHLCRSGGGGRVCTPQFQLFPLPFLNPCRQATHMPRLRALSVSQSINGRRNLFSEFRETKTRFVGELVLVGLGPAPYPSSLQRVLVYTPKPEDRPRSAWPFDPSHWRWGSSLSNNRRCPVAPRKHMFSPVTLPRSLSQI